jgi:hypothetical protein
MMSRGRGGTIRRRNDAFGTGQLAVDVTEVGQESIVTCFHATTIHV